MKATAILGALGIAAMLGSPAVDAQAASLPTKTIKRARPVMSTPDLVAATPTRPVIRRHKCVVGCG